MPALLAAALLLVPVAAPSQLRPFVVEMLENLASLNAIGEGVALENYDKVRVGAEKLAAIAEHLSKQDLAELGFDQGRKPQFDAFLSIQRETALQIRDAATAKDADGVMLGVNRLTTGACLSCHSSFRAAHEGLRPAVLFMTTLLSSWQDMNRGVMTDDFDLVARRAREMGTTTRVFEWKQVIASTFGLQKPEEIDAFADLLRNLTTHASRIEQGAVEQDAGAVLGSMNAMWSESCLSCHERFRGRVAQSAPR